MPRILSRTFLTLALAFSACSSDGGGGTGGAGGGGGGAGGSTKPQGFHVSGRFLYDRCENKVLLRGVNEMVLWGNQDGVPVYSEIAKTGANAVRIVWGASGSAAALDTTIANALAQKLIPIVENHDATGELTKVPAAVDYWVKDDVVKVLTKYQDKIILNIANEAAGNDTVVGVFEETYTTAITRLRAAGYTMPLMIDGASWGSNIVILFAIGPTFIDADPLHNILLSVHTYWDDADGALVQKRMQEIEDKNLPFVVGEFADELYPSCKPGSFNVQVLMAEAQAHQVGWLAWSWGAVKNSNCAGNIDMTSDGTFAGLKDWGLVVATTDANSIKNTSVLSPYIVNGSCN